jgi:hypothetical protein
MAFETLLNLHAVFSVVDYLIYVFDRDFSGFVWDFGGDGNPAITQLGADVFAGDIGIDVYSICIGCGFRLFEGRSVPDSTELEYLHNAAFDTFGGALHNTHNFQTTVRQCLGNYGSNHRGANIQGCDYVVSSFVTCLYYYLVIEPQVHNTAAGDIAVVLHKLIAPQCGWLCPFLQV